MKKILILFIAIISVISVTAQGGFKSDGRIAPTGNYPITKFGEAQTGWWPLTRKTERDSIPTWQRTYGMLVYVKDVDSVYQLKSISLDNTNWVPFKIGSVDLSNYYTQTQVNTLLTGKQDALGYTPVPNTRTINSYPLSANITLAKSDVGLGNVPNVDATNPANITQSSSYRFATDAEKTNWNSAYTFTNGYSITNYYTTLDARYFRIGNNLSEGTAATMRTNLGLGSFALRNSIDTTDISNFFTKVRSLFTAGTNITISNGTINNTYSYTLPVATPSVLGGVKIGTNITYAGDGTISLTSTGVTGALGYTPENAANKGAANGYASLDGGTKVPVAQLPSTLMIYKGTWNASTNSPTLSDGTGTSGFVYQVSVAGTQNLGSGSISFLVGDYIMHNGSIWQKSAGTNYVTSVSVNGSTAQQGTVNITLPNSSVTNAMLANSSVTVNGNSVALGSSTTVTANTPNSHVIKFDGGTTEGTDLYTFNGGAAKTINLVAGTNITLTKAAGQVTITNGITNNNQLTNGAGFITGNQTITLSGDATGSGATGIAITLANSGVTAGTYTKVTVDAKGRVTTGASLASADLPTYTGTLTSTQVTTALGYTPYNSTNPNNYLSSVSLTANVTGILPISNGGTGSATQNFVDLTTNQTVGGNKIFTNALRTNSDLTVDGQSYLRYNNTYLYGRNAADNAYYSIIGINTLNKVSIDNNGVGTILGGSLTGTNGKFIDPGNTFSVQAGGNSSTPNIVALGTSVGIPTIQGYNSGFTAVQPLQINPNGGAITLGGSLTGTIATFTAASGNTLTIAKSNNIPSISFTGASDQGVLEYSTANGFQFYNPLIGTKSVFNSSTTASYNPATYTLRLQNSGSDNLTLGSDATYSYIQSWASKPLYLNYQGNPIYLGGSLYANYGIFSTSSNYQIAINSTNSTGNKEQDILFQNQSTNKALIRNVAGGNIFDFYSYEYGFYPIRISSSGKTTITASGTGVEGIFVNKTDATQATIRFKSTHDAYSDWRVGASILTGSAFEIYNSNTATSYLTIAGTSGHATFSANGAFGGTLDVTGIAYFRNEVQGGWNGDTYTWRVTSAGAAQVASIKTASSNTIVFGAKITTGVFGNTGHALPITVDGVTKYIMLYDSTN